MRRGDPDDRTNPTAVRARRRQIGTTGRHPAALTTRHISSPACESRYRPRPSRNSRGLEANRILRPVLTDPETVPITAEQHEQAISALSAMIVAWLQARAHRGRRLTG